MSDPLLTKRLHISGLTPAITPRDLERRLSSFGSVTTMDGFDARDALGDPRKFGFVTMEIGEKALSKCLNALSGSTWKGTKLRIGEAKPDFRERLARFNAQPPQPVRPKRTRVRNHGYASSALSPLSAAAAAATPGWIVTPSGRVVRPMRMRPERPMEPMHNELVSKARGLIGKAKKRIKPPPTRARRRLIDPTKWDSTYLKGVFLDAVPISDPILRDASGSFGKADDVADEDDDNEAHGEGAKSDEPAGFISLIDEPEARPQKTSFTASSRMQENDEDIDLHEETSVALAMLGQMFGDEEDWDGRESVEGLESDETKMTAMQVDGDDDIEIVPRDFGKGKKRKGSDLHKEEELSDESDQNVQDAPRDRDLKVDDIVPASTSTAETLPSTNLKALFAPREDVPFSLVGHLDLDLDLELEADIFGIGAPASTSQENVRQPRTILPSVNVQIPTRVSTKRAHSRVTLDPSLPLLYPTSCSLPHQSTLPSIPMTTPRLNDCYTFPSATRATGLYPSSAFTRSPHDTSESIRERWENDKSSLTREWKKSWREARGSRRRGVGAAGELAGY